MLQRANRPLFAQVAGIVFTVSLTATLAANDSVTDTDAAASSLRDAASEVSLLADRFADTPADPVVPPLVNETIPTGLAPEPVNQLSPGQPPPAAPAPAAASPAKKKPAPPLFPPPQTLPPVGPWKLFYFDNDFSYKKDPKHEYLPGEELKDMPGEIFGIPLLFSTGGEIRHRYMSEANRLRPGGIPNGNSASYNLIRWRQYFDLRVGDFRVYFEGIEADKFGGSLPDQPIDVDQWDVLNLFGDWKFYNEDGLSQTVRYGRQELSYGKQRLVSPLDWANTRRNFEGGRYIAKGDTYTFDLFCVHPVNSATGYNSGTGYNQVPYYQNHPNQPNNQVFFSGAYYNYTGIQNTSIDLYWLFLDTTSYPNTSTPIGSRHTMGGRYGALYPVDNGSRVWDFDTESALQFGSNLGSDVFAGFYTAVGGHTWKEVPWTPRLSGTFYYGSGTNRTGSTSGTFNTLFPLSHAYWALSDNVLGQNVFNYAVQADVKPTQKLAFSSAYHWFKLVNEHDNLYLVSGSPLAASAHGPGTNVGTALDLYGYYAFSKQLDVQAGYSWFFFGDYFTTAAGERPDCTQLYVQTTLRY